MNASKYIILLLQMWVAQGYAQLQVHEEPLHHPVLTKSGVRVLDVIAYPNDTSLIHQHSSNYVYVTINGGKIWVENAGEQGRALVLPKGFIGGYFENPTTPLIHRFANRSEGLLRLIAVENLSVHGAKDTSYHFLPNEELLINNAFFIVSKFRLSPKSRLDFLTFHSTVVVNLNQWPLTVRIQKHPEVLEDWKYIDKQSKIRIYNWQSEETTIVLIQLKQVAD